MTNILSNTCRLITMNPQIVYFTVNTSSISSDMRVPSEIMELAQKRFDLVNFDLELDVSHDIHHKW